MPSSGAHGLGAAGGSQQCLLSKSSTYLAKIAVVLQGTPDKMLTFTQLMDKLAPLMCEDRKSVENNIRVCLSINKCFVKIPVDPDSPASKKNYWKLDPRHITGKMVRRHFKGLLQLFPELASKVETEDTGRPSASRPDVGQPRQPAPVRLAHVPRQVKFTGPFSIEALMKSDGASEEEAPGGGAQQVREEQREPPRAWVDATRSFSWNPEEHYVIHAPARSSLICSAGGSTHHELPAYAAPVMIHVFPEPPFPVYTEPPFPVHTEPPFPVHTEPPFPVHTEPPFPIHARPSVAPSFSTPRSGCYTYSLPTFTTDALYFPL